LRENLIHFIFEGGDTATYGPSSRMKHHSGRLQGQQARMQSYPLSELDADGRAGTYGTGKPIARGRRNDLGRASLNW
jgi:hypothetical protein